MLSELTVVVTNYQRPESFSKSLHSLLSASIVNVVIVSLETCPESRQTIECFLEKAPPEMRVDMLFQKDDLGSNELWLQGIYRTQTPYVLLLDEESLSTRFGEVFDTLLFPALRDGAGFATWGVMGGNSRICGSGGLVRMLYNERADGLSPGKSVLSRSACIAALKESAQFLKGSNPLYTANLSAASSVLIYLRHCELFETFFYADDNLSSKLGTPEDEKISNPLRAAAKAHFKANPSSRKLTLTPRIIHLFSDYAPPTKEEVRRRRFFDFLWSILYRSGKVIPFAISSKDVARTSKTELGDARDLLFIRDILDIGARAAGKDDLMMLTNTDTLPLLTLPDKVLAMFVDPLVSAAYGYRRNFTGPIVEIKSDLVGGSRDNGVDLVAVRPDWWRENRLWFPDFVLGCESWDWVFRVLLDEAFPKKEIAMDHIVYHEWHDAVWRQPSVRTVHRAQAFNRRITQNFFARRADDTSALTMRKDCQSFGVAPEDEGKVRFHCPEKDPVSGYWRLAEACKLALNSVSVPEEAIPEVVLAYPTVVVDAPVRFTMWEPSEYPKKARGFMGSGALVVPSMHNLKVFTESGFSGKIHVVPLFGEAPFVEMPDQSVLKFICVARDSGVRSRKGIDDLIEYFKLAFPTQKDVRLTVKSSPKCFRREPQDDRITILTRDVSKEAYEKLLGEHHCGVMLSGLEGWNFPTMELMACGRTSIVVPYGGPADYANSENSYQLDYEMVQAPIEPHYFGVGQCAKPLKDSVIAAFREVYADRTSLLRKAINAYETSQNYTKEKFGERLRAVVGGILGRDVANLPFA